MVIHECPRCHYKTSRKSLIRNHFNKKKVCKIEYDDISIEECLKRLNNKIHICEYCKKEYKYRSYLKRHQEKCNNKNIIEENKKLKEENEMLRQTQVSHNTTINGDQINNNNTINININSFKDTDYGKIQNEVKKCVKNGQFNIHKFIELVHGNKDIPENHNIMITDAREKKIMEYDGNSFKMRDSGLLGLDKLLKETNEKIEKDIIDDDVVDFSNELMEHYNSSNDTRKNEILKGIAVVLYNNKDMVKETHGIK